MAQRNENRVLDDLQVSDRYVKVDNEDVTLETHQTTIEALSDSSAVEITLPNVGEAVGKIYGFTAADGGTNAVTITDQGESVDWSDIALNAANDEAVLYSDGRKWHLLAG